MGARVASSLARATALPTSVRAVLGYYADTGVFDLTAIRIKRYADATIDAIVDEAYAAVEAEIAAEFDRDPASVEFSYDTKLTMPATLTLGHVYQRLLGRTPDGVNPVTGEASSSVLASILPPYRGNTRGDAVPDRHADEREQVELVEDVTRLVVEALLDGDIRDAINDDEFEDVEVNFDVDEAERRRVAEVAQGTLEERVAEMFARYPDSVEAAYDWAVDVSEAHQDRDPRFREVARLAVSGDPEADRRIEEEYKFAPFEEEPDLFSAAELEFPYLKTQYGRVGVIYDGMIEMYRAAGVPVSSEFKKSIVLSIIGAQIWLDDIDDFEDDLAEEQLTPVTAEYWLADDDRVAYDRVVDVTTRYLDEAKRYAAATDSTLTGIGVDYIYRSGNPDVLPGSDR